LTTKGLAVALLVAFPAQAMAVDSAFIRSLLVPGTGQAHQGHYTRAAAYAGVAVLSGFGLVISQVYYNEAVDKYDAQKRIYASYDETLSEGGVVSIKDIEGTYALMQAEHDSAEKRFAWRNGFLVAFAATYAINLVDVLISKPYDADRQVPVSVEAGPGGVRITRTFRF
jgi:hypothetical protein